MMLHDDINEITGRSAHALLVLSKYASMNLIPGGDVCMIRRVSLMLILMSSSSQNERYVPVASWMIALRETATRTFDVDLMIRNVTFGIESDEMKDVMSETMVLSVSESRSMETMISTGSETEIIEMSSMDDLDETDSMYVCAD